MKTKYEEMKGGSSLLDNNVHLPAFGQEQIHLESPLINLCGLF